MVSYYDHATKKVARPTILLNKHTDDAHDNPTLAIDDSALYQALHRLEARKLVVGEWGVSENNRRARYYELTPAGRAHLDAASAHMVSYAKTITNLLTVAAKPR